MRRTLLLVGLAALPAALGAQSSQFGVRGLGLPGRAASARSLGMGGSLSLFDGESSRNPASLAMLTQTTAIFTANTNWRTSTNPAGSATARDTRFPQMLIGGPVPKTHFALGFSYSTFADRDFTLVSSGSESPRGVPVGFTDTLTSLGGINDLRLATSFAFSKRLVIGGGIHFLTGSNRLSSRRAWEDTTYLASLQKAELSYKSVGFSAGVLWQPMAGLAFAGAVRKDGTLDIERDSTASGSITLPTTLTGGVRLRIARGVELAGDVTSRNWSVADAGIRAQGAIGARDAFEATGGVELITNAKRPSHKPIRLGARYAKIPFLLATGAQPTEWGISAGTGFRFAEDRGGIDLALERVERKQGGNYTEHGWIFTVGISVRSGGFRP